MILETSNEDLSLYENDKEPELTYSGYGSSRNPPDVIGDDGIRIEEEDTDGRDCTNIGDIFFCCERCKLEFAKKNKVTSFDIAY